MRSKKFRANKKWLIAAGVIFTALLLVCIVITALAGGIGWLFSQDERSQLIRISSLAPLSTSAPTLLPPNPEESTTTIEATLIPSSPTPLSLPENQPPPLPENTTTPLPQQPPPTIVPEYIAPVTRVVIPRLNLDSPVALSPLENETWKVDHLNQAVGYLEGTALPGVDSNFVLAGHVTLASGVDGPFINLNRLAPNDEILVHSNGQEFVYVVNTIQTVNREAVEVTHPSDNAEITLITCSNWNSAENRYIDRLVVKGHLKQ